MNKKLKAFTLSEVIVVLIVTMIVVGIAFSVLRLVTFQLGTIQDVYKEQNEILHVQQQLKFDLENAQRLYYNSEDESFVVYGIRDTIRYRFSSKKISRQDKTSALEIIEIKGFSKGVEVSQTDIDAIQCTIKTKRGEILVFEQMNNSARYSMQ